jgi:hypothetical protein
MRLFAAEDGRGCDVRELDVADELPGAREQASVL